MSKTYKNEKEAADALASIYKELKQEVGKVIIGQEDVVEKLIIALFCKGHSLLVGVPGLAKNTPHQYGLPGTRPEIQPDPVYPGPDAGRYPRF